MTEEEAQTRWCPFARIAPFVEGAAINRECDGSVRASAKCIGSACMAWQTRHQWLDNAQEQPGWVSYAPYAFEPGPGQERDDGFCGLAGRPE